VRTLPAGAAQKEIVRDNEGAAMLVADRVIALAIIGLSLYFMWHAIELPIGWNGQTGGPGGGAFPFWLSLIMALCAGGILVRSIGVKDTSRFFDSETIRSVIVVAVALIVTIALIPIVGAYVALILFMLWYLKLLRRAYLDADAVADAGRRRWCCSSSSR
jgi:putative tricarboxylic transport membrane protein